MLVRCFVVCHGARCAQVTSTVIETRCIRSHFGSSVVDTVHLCHRDPNIAALRVMSKRARAEVVDMVERLELVLPIPVAVVGFGKKHDTVTGAWLAKMQENVHLVDLRDRLPEQSQDRVLHGQDASHTKTQIAVYSQSGFADVIMESIEESVGRAMITRTGFIVAGKCNTACHRADTFRQTLRDCLNSVHCGDVKVFNAQYFSLHEAGSSSEQKYVLEQAVLWSTRPWTTIDQPAVFDRFARKAVALRSESQWSYETVWQFVDEEMSSDAWQSKMSNAFVPPPIPKARPILAVRKALPRPLKHRPIGRDPSSMRPAPPSFAPPPDFMGEDSSDSTVDVVEPGTGSVDTWVPPDVFTDSLICE